MTFEFGPHLLPCLFLRRCCLIHSVQVAFQSIHMNGPEPAELRQPFIQLVKRFRFQMVEATLRIYRRFHKSGFAQYSQMLRDRGLRHPKLPLDLAHGPF